MVWIAFHLYHQARRELRLLWRYRLALLQRIAPECDYRPFWRFILRGCIDNRKNVRVENNVAAADPNFKNQKLGVGDVIYRDYDGFVMSEGVFAQLEYNYDKLSAFVSGGLSNTSYWRYDRLYYDKAPCQVRQETLPGRKRQRRY